jgi:hypothetical protein
VTRAYLGIVALDGAYLLVGLAVLARLGFVVSLSSALRYAGLAVVAGWVCFGILASVTLMLGGALGGWWLPGLLALTAALALAVPSRTRLPPPAPAAASERQWLALALVPAAALAAYAAALLARAFVAATDTNWDSWAFWLPKAQAIFYFDGLDTGPGGFTSFANPEYPPFAPGTEAATLHAMGGVERLALPLQHWVLAVAFVAAVAGLLAPRVRPAILWPFVAMLGLAPALGKYVLSSLADPQVAFLIALGGVAAALWLLERQPAYLVLSGLFLTAATLTKTEGFMLAAIVPLALLLAEPRALRRRWRPVAALAVGPVLALVAWKAWLAAHDQPLDSTLYDVTAVLHPVHLIENADRMGYAVPQLLDFLLSPERWLLVVPVAVVAAALALKPQRRLAVFALSWLTIAFLGLATVYWIASVDVTWYVDTSAERVVTSIALFAGALAPLLAAEAGRQSRRT